MSQPVPPTRGQARELPACVAWRIEHTVLHGAPFTTITAPVAGTSYVSN